MRAALIVLVALAALTWVETSVGAAPRFVRNIDTGETGWFASPALVDLDGDRRLEIVAPFYSTFVYDARGRLLGKGTATEGRVYAPGVVADLDGDGAKEIVVGGNEGTVAAYDRAGGGLKWRASTCSGGQCPETRGMAAGDLDRDGRIEVVATTTNTVAHRLAGLRLRRVRRGRRRLAAVQRVRRRLQRHGQPRLRRLRRERRHRPARRRPAARGRRHLRQPPDQPLQPRRDVGARVAVVHEPAERLRRPPARLGPVHPLAEPEGRATTTTTGTSASGRTRARRRGCSGRPRRPRSPTSTATAATR